MNSTHLQSRTTPILIGVIEGPGQGQNAFLYPGDTLVIGRRVTEGLKIPDPEVSSRHIQLIYSPQGIVAEDLDSANGSWIRGSHEIIQPTYVHQGQTIHLGENSSVFIFPKSPDFPHLPGMRFRKMLGVGSQANVYDVQLDEDPFRAAIKVVPKHLRDKDRKRIEREAHVLTRLSHPSIAKCFGMKMINSHMVLINELIEGQTIEAALEKHGKVLWTTAFNLALAATNALNYAHSCGVIHRDIKPGNIILSADGSGLKIIDFGFARKTASKEVSLELTSLMEVVGTWDYMAPEGFSGGKELDQRADVFSLAATVYEMIEGQTPFPECAAGDQLHAREEGPRMMTQLPDYAANALLQALEFDPERRTQSMSEFAKHLSSAIETSQSLNQ